MRIRAHFWLLVIALALLVIPSEGVALLAKEPQQTPDGLASAERMRQDVAVLTSMDPPRSNGNMASLNRSADHIAGELRKAGCQVTEQKFPHDGKVYRNIVAPTSPEKQNAW